MSVNSEPTSTPTLTVDDFETLAQRVDQAMAEVRGLEAPAKNKALDLKAAIEEFHKVGLTKIVKTLKQDPQGKELLFSLVDDPSVYALFSMHGLVRADLRTQVSRVLEMVRPYMQSHGGDVELVDVRDKIVFVRLAGNCNGCSMSSVTLRNTVEESLREHVPEIEKVEVDPTDPAASSGPILQLGGVSQSNNSANAGPGDSAQQSDIEPEHGWIQGPEVGELEDKPIAEFTHGDDKVIIIKSNKGLRAYRNACAHQGLPLDGGIVDEESGTITCPWHGFQFDSENGECFSAPQ